MASGRAGFPHQRVPSDALAQAAPSQGSGISSLAEQPRITADCNAVFRLAWFSARE